MGSGLLRRCTVAASLAAGLLLPALPIPAAPAPAAPAAAQADASPQSQAVVDLVEAAAQEVKRRGEAAFADFRVPGSRWYQGERYVFVVQPDGQRLVYPPDPAHEQSNILKFQDVGGKTFARLIIEQAAEGRGRGWVHYQWTRPNPHDRRPVWKSTYVVRVTAPSGRTYLVASGTYDGPTEKAFIVEEVEAAAALLQRQGRAAFPQLRDPTGRFLFRDTYVFVDTPAGVELVNPAFPELEGRNLSDLRDASGKMPVLEYIAKALADGSGWTQYYWLRPGGSKLQTLKSTYVRKVVLPDGETLIVGSGLYEP